MTAQPHGVQAVSRKVWLRRALASDPCVKGNWKSMPLRKLGLAAAHETFTTNTRPFAPVWAGLFQSMLAPSDPLMKWRDSGPGVGRDARVAYSSLLGRYMARAYLMANEGVQVLVPLDTARQAFQSQSRYYIEKKPAGNGLEADWIGLDDKRLVIAEAKGSSDRTISSWKGKKSVPQLLHNAMAQASRTKVCTKPTNQPLPARRWAVASRWGNQENRRDPTLLAWGQDNHPLDEDDYGALANLLLRVDIKELLNELGYPEEVRHIDQLDERPRSARERRFLIGERLVEPGFVAAVGPAGIFALRSLEDATVMLIVRDLLGDRFPFTALVSLSSRFVDAVARDAREALLEDQTDAMETEEGVDGLLVRRAGLTVAWLLPGIRVRFVD